MSKVSTITSGPIQLDDIREEFEIAEDVELQLHDLYAGGQYIQQGAFRNASASQATLDGMTVNQRIPSSGAISLRNFYGVRKLPFIFFDPSVVIPLLDITERVQTPTVKEIQIYYRALDKRIVVHDISNQIEYPITQPIDITDDRVSVRVNNISGQINGTVGTDVIFNAATTLKYQTTSIIGETTNRTIEIILKDNIITTNTASIQVTIRAINTFEPLLWKNVTPINTLTSNTVNGQVTARSAIEYTTAVKKARLRIGSDWQEVTEQETAANRVQFKAKLIGGSVVSGDTNDTWKPITNLVDWVVTTGINSKLTTQIEVILRDSEQTTNTKIYNLVIEAENLYKNFVWDGATGNINVNYQFAQLTPQNKEFFLYVSPANRVTIVDDTDNEIGVISENTYGRVQFTARVTAGVLNTGANIADNTLKNTTTGTKYAMGVTTNKQQTNSATVQFTFRDSLNTQNTRVRTVVLTCINTFTQIVFNNLSWASITNTGSNAVSIDAVMTLAQLGNGNVTLNGTGRTAQILTANSYNRLEYKLVKTSGADLTAIPSTAWSSFTTYDATMQQLKDTSGAKIGDYELSFRDSQEQTNTKQYNISFQTTNTFKTVTYVLPTSGPTGDLTVTKQEFVNADVPVWAKINLTGTVVTFSTQNGTSKVVVPNTQGRLQYKTTVVNTSGAQVTSWVDVPTGDTQWTLTTGTNQTKNGSVLIVFRDSQEPTTTTQFTVSMQVTNTFIDIAWGTFAGQTLSNSSFVNGPVTEDYQLQLNAASKLTDSEGNVVTENSYGRLQFKTTITAGTFAGGELLGVSAWTDWTNVSSKTLQQLSDVNQTKQGSLRIELRDKLNTSNIKTINMTLVTTNTFVKVAYPGDPGGASAYNGLDKTSSQFINGDTSTQATVSVNASNSLLVDGTTIIANTYGRLQIRVTNPVGTFSSGSLPAKTAWTNMPANTSFDASVLTNVNQTKSATLTVEIRDQSDTQVVYQFTFKLSVTNTFIPIVWNAESTVVITKSALIFGQVTDTLVLNHSGVNNATIGGKTVTGATYGRLQMKYELVSGEYTTSTINPTYSNWAGISGTTSVNSVLTATVADPTKSHVFKIHFRDSLDQTNVKIFTVTMNVSNTFRNIVWQAATQSTVSVVQKVPAGSVTAQYALSAANNVISDNGGRVWTDDSYGRIQYKITPISGSAAGGSLGTATNWGDWTEAAALTYSNSAGQNATTTSQFTLQLRDKLNPANQKDITVTVTSQNTYVPFQYVAVTSANMGSVDKFVVDANAIHSFQIIRDGNRVYLKSEANEVTLVADDKGRSRLTVSGITSLTGSAVTNVAVNNQQFQVTAANNSSGQGQLTLVLTDQDYATNKITVTVSIAVVNTYVPITLNTSMSGTTINFGRKSDKLVDGNVAHQIRIDRSGGTITLRSITMGGQTYAISTTDTGNRLRVQAVLTNAPSVGAAVTGFNPDATQLTWITTAGNNTIKDALIAVTVYDSAKPSNSFTFNVSWGSQNTYVPLVLSQALNNTTIDLGTHSVLQPNGTVQHAIRVERSGATVAVKQIDRSITHNIVTADNEGRLRCNAVLTSAPSAGTAVSAFNPDATQLTWRNDATNNTTKVAVIQLTFYDDLKPSNQIVVNVSWGAQNTYVPFQYSVAGSSTHSMGQTSNFVVDGNQTHQFQVLRSGNRVYIKSSTSEVTLVSDDKGRSLLGVNGLTSLSGTSFNGVAVNGQTFTVSAGNNQTVNGRLTLWLYDSQLNSNSITVTVNITTVNTYAPITLNSGMHGQTYNYGRNSQLAVDANVHHYVRLERAAQTVTLKQVTLGGSTFAVCSNDVGERLRINAVMSTAPNEGGAVSAANPNATNLTWGVYTGNNQTKDAVISITAYDSVKPANQITFNIAWGSTNTYVPIVFNSTFGDFGWVRQQVNGNVWHQFNVERSGNHVYFRDIHTGATHTICADDQGRSQFVQWNGDTNASPIDGGQYYPNWTTQNLHGYSIYSGTNNSKGTRVNITFRDPLKPANQVAHQVTMYVQNTYIPYNAAAIQIGSIDVYGNATPGASYHEADFILRIWRSGGNAYLSVIVDSRWSWRSPTQSFDNLITGNADAYDFMISLSNFQKVQNPDIGTSLNYCYANPENVNFGTWFDPAQSGQVHFHAYKTANQGTATVTGTITIKMREKATGTVVVQHSVVAVCRVNSKA